MVPVAAPLGEIFCDVIAKVTWRGSCRKMVPCISLLVAKCCESKTPVARRPGGLWHTVVAFIKAKQEAQPTLVIPSKNGMIVSINGVAISTATQAGEVLRKVVGDCEVVVERIEEEEEAALAA